jgi:hypothetical protein
MSLLTTVSPIVLLVAGFVVCFFGYRLLRLTLGLAGFGVGLALGLAIAKLAPGASHVFTAVIGIVCGILGAVLAAVLYKFGVFLLGAGAGALVAGILVAATGWHHPMLIRALGAVFGGILTLVLERPLISVLSAFAGGWGIVYGAVKLLGLLRWHHVAARAKTPPAHFGVMVVCWLVFGFIGAGIQLRAAGRKKKGLK